MSKPILATKEDFEKEVNAFWSWTAHRPRVKSAWFFALERYASRMGNLAFDVEVAKAAEEKKQ